MFNRDINILVTGAKGQLGSYLVDFFSRLSIKKHSRIGKVLGVGIDDLDIRNASAVEQFFGSSTANPLVKIDYVVHCAAATNTEVIEAHPEDYFAANCLGAKNIAKSCVRNGIKMVFISTDYVLSEKSPVADDCIQEFPVNQYGLQKLIAELFVKDAYRSRPKDCLVLRPSWMFGNSENSFVEKFLKTVFTICALEAKSTGSTSEVEVPVADDAYGQPTPVWYIADTLKSLMLHGIYGTHDLHYPHLQISRYDWASMIWRAFVDGTNNIDHAEFKIVNALKGKVKIVPRHSKDIGMHWHHPGKIPADFSTHGCMIDASINKMFIDDTNMYVKKNLHKYIKLAESIGIKG